MTYEPVKPSMRPTVGRIVHYQSYESQDRPSRPLAALVTAVFDDPRGVVDLVVFDERGFSLRVLVVEERGEQPVAGRWNWPPRVTV